MLLKAVLETQRKASVILSSTLKPATTTPIERQPSPAILVAALEVEGSSNEQALTRTLSNAILHETTSAISSKRRESGTPLLNTSLLRRSRSLPVLFHCNSSEAEETKQARLDYWKVQAESHPTVEGIVHPSTQFAGFDSQTPSRYAKSAFIFIV